MQRRRLGGVGVLLPHPAVRRFQQIWVHRVVNQQLRGSPLGEGQALAAILGCDGFVALVCAQGVFGLIEKGGPPPDPPQEGGLGGGPGGPIGGGGPGGATGGGGG